MLDEAKEMFNFSVQNNCCIHIREHTIITRNGVEISRIPEDRVLHPGTDVSGEPENIQAVAAVLWTQEVIDACNALQAE